MANVLIRLDDEFEDRLTRLAHRTGRSKTFYVKEAIMEKLTDYEDYYLAKDSLAEFIQSDDEAIDLAAAQWPSE